MLVTLIVFINPILITLINHDRFVTYNDRHSSYQSLIDANSSALGEVGSIAQLHLQNSISALIIMCAMPIIHRAHLLSPSFIS